MFPLTKNDRKNAFLYCKFRDEQFALYDAYVKSNGMLMNTFLVLNVLFYAKDGITQKEICERTFQSKQTVGSIIKSMLNRGYVMLMENSNDKRNKTVRLTRTGRAYAEKPVRHITCAEDRAMAMFTQEERKQLIKLSRTFTKNLTELVNQETEE